MKDVREHEKTITYKIKKMNPSPSEAELDVFNTFIYRAQKDKQEEEKQEPKRNVK